MLRYTACVLLVLRNRRADSIFQDNPARLLTNVAQSQFVLTSTTASAAPGPHTHSGVQIRTLCISDQQAGHQRSTHPGAWEHPNAHVQDPAVLHLPWQAAALSGHSRGDECECRPLHNSKSWFVTCVCEWNLCISNRSQCCPQCVCHSSTQDVLRIVSNITTTGLQACVCLCEVCGCKVCNVRCVRGMCVCGCKVVHSFAQVPTKRSMGEPSKRNKHVELCWSVKRHSFLWHVVMNTAQNVHQI